MSDCQDLVVQASDSDLNSGSVCLTALPGHDSFAFFVSVTWEGSNALSSDGLTLKVRDWKGASLKKILLNDAVDLSRLVSWELNANVLRIVWSGPELKELRGKIKISLA